MRGIEKSFPGVKALRGVSLTLQAGEVLAVLGENGAGKSTLMKVLGGAHPADSGTLEIDGQEVVFRSPREAAAAGIAVIYQEFNLVPGLTASENIFLGQELTLGFKRRHLRSECSDGERLSRRDDRQSNRHFHLRSLGGLIDISGERRKAGELFQRLGIDIDVDLPCRLLATSQQQLVEIAKALAFDARILVMDEPTAALTTREVEKLFKIIRELKQQGLGIIYISHRLDEIFKIADRVTFLRDGENVGDRNIETLTRKTMIEHMVGRELKDEFPQRDVAIGRPKLVVKDLCSCHKVKNVSFEIRQGEIVALTGLVGAGRTETARLIFGADKCDSGVIDLDGKSLRIRSPRDAIESGIGLLTEDRKLQGLVLGMSAVDNFGLPSLERLSSRGFLQKRTEKQEFQHYKKTLEIKVVSPEQRIGDLSGGNQQKVILAKWLARHCEVLIFDEPTRGIDVGTKFEIYKLMNEFVAQGKSILMISSELSEVLGMA
ncbi:MAG: sugar ABC transporter ATP-binding protein, partial [Planctomycetes bacterium]|nr:sugar ABC transporter ATP-binding protein [Planctomycetota bacterium]